MEITNEVMKNVWDAIQRQMVIGRSSAELIWNESEFRLIVGLLFIWGLLISFWCYRSCCQKFKHTWQKPFRIEKETNPKQKRAPQVKWLSQTSNDRLSNFEPTILKTQTNSSWHLSTKHVSRSGQLLRQMRQKFEISRNVQTKNLVIIIIQASKFSLYRKSASYWSYSWSKLKLRILFKLIVRQTRRTVINSETPRSTEIDHRRVSHILQTHQTFNNKLHKYLWRGNNATCIDN